MVISIRFDTATALACATERKWSLQDWANLAGVTQPSIRAFLAGDQRLKLITVEQILQPLGIRASDILITPPPLRIHPRGPMLTGEDR